MAIRHPQFKTQMEAYIARLVDLLPMVREGYYHPDMKGSFSIKKVISAAVGAGAYGNLVDVQDGIQAQLAYIEVARDDSLSPSRKKAIEANALSYCKQDTWSMVQVASLLLGDAPPPPP